MKNKLFRAAASALLTLLLVITLLPVQAHAAGATLTGTAAPQAGDTVTLTLSVPNKVYGLTADLSYSGNLSFTNYNCSVSGWSIVVNNNKFSVYGTSSSSGGLVTIKMKVSGSAKEGDALTATFSNIVVSDGNSDTSLDSASWSGKVGAAPSGNCSLSSLSCSNATLSPSFSSSTTYYTCTVPFAVEKLDLNYKKADNSATVSVSGNELAVGVNTVTIKVTAANGATKSYTIDATRQQDPNYKPSTDASIAALTLEGATLSPAFTPTVTDYIAYVPYETKQVTIAATAKDEKAQGITGTGEVRLSATEAETVLTVTGTAEDGKTKQNYTIHVLRMPAYTGIVPTVEVIDPATIPEVPPLEIPGTIAMPLIGEVKTVYVAIAAAVLLVVLLFKLILGDFGPAGSNKSYPVPDIRGKTVEEAQEMEGVKDIFLIEVQGTRTTEEYQPGQIVEQDPAAGRTRKSNLVIQVYVAAEPEKVPMKDLVGMEYRQARVLLTDMGLDLKITTETVSSDKYGADAVIETVPVADEPLVAGQTVILRVSTGPETVTVPTFTGQDIANAVQNAQDLGLTVGEITYDTFSFAPQGQVIEQSIKPTSEVPGGTKISFTVSGQKNSDDATAARVVEFTMPSDMEGMIKVEFEQDSVTLDSQYINASMGTVTYTFTGKTGTSSNVCAVFTSMNTGATKVSAIQEIRF